MGRVTLTACDKAAHQFSILVRERLVRQETTLKAFAPRVGICAETLSDKLRRRPGTFTFAEMHAMCSRLHIKPEELAEIICGEVPGYAKGNR